MTKQTENKHERFIRRCFELALKGQGNVAPNPMVGCVIVNDSSEIISEGFHQQYGGPHAEVNAIKALPPGTDLSSCTVYVSLEPCAHYGKTPPCAELLVSSGVQRVVIANLDPHEKVAGKGVAILEAAGIDVISGVLEHEGAHLNRAFFTFHQKKRPYIALKWAQSLDGYVDIRRGPNDKGIHWITTPECKQLTHSWRAELQAILVGTGTALIDNPSLTVRESAGSNPLRLLIDRNLKISSDANVFKADANTVVYNSIKEGHEEHIEYVQLPFEQLRDEILDDLYERNVISLMIEGGAKTLQNFINANLWDEARILEGPRYFGTAGLRVTPPQGRLSEHYFYGENRVMIIHNT